VGKYIFMKKDIIENYDLKNSSPENIQRIQKAMVEAMGSIGWGSDKRAYIQQLKEKREEFFNNQDVWDFLYANNGINLKMCEEAWRISPKKAWEVLQNIETHSELYQQVGKSYRMVMINFSRNYDKMFDEKRKRFNDIEKSVENIARKIVDPEIFPPEDLSNFMGTSWLMLVGSLISSYTYRKEFISDDDLEEELEGVITEFSPVEVETENFKQYLKKILQEYIKSGADAKFISASSLPLIIENGEFVEQDFIELFDIGLVWSQDIERSVNSHQFKIVSGAWEKHQSRQQKILIEQSLERENGKVENNTSPRKI